MAKDDYIRWSEAFDVLDYGLSLQEMKERIQRIPASDVIDRKEYDKIKEERDAAISYGNDMSWGCVAKEYEGW